MKVWTHFGSRSETLAELEQVALQEGLTRAYRLQQIHSAKVFSTDNLLTGTGASEFSAGDGLWTALPGELLLVATADCLPVLIVDHLNERVAAVHAGWRGVYLRIIPELLVKWGFSPEDRSAGLEHLRFYVGPHIQQDSFEVGVEVVEMLEKSVTGELPSVWKREHPSSGKAHVSLGQVVLGQLREFGIESSSVEISKRDTKTDPELSSFRRDGKNSGRNWSGIGFIRPSR